MKLFQVRFKAKRLNELVKDLHETYMDVTDYHIGFKMNDIMRLSGEILDGIEELEEIKNELEVPQEAKPKSLFSRYRLNDLDKERWG